MTVDVLIVMVKIFTRLGLVEFSTLDEDSRKEGDGSVDCDAKTDADAFANGVADLLGTVERTGTEGLIEFFNDAPIEIILVALYDTDGT